MCTPVMCLVPPPPDEPRSATENEVTNVCTKMLNPWPNNLVSFNYYNENVNYIDDCTEDIWYMTWKT